MKLGLALSGGTFRGTAHIGVLEALHEAGIKPDMVAGTSAGSVVAALYAHGLSPATIRKIALNFKGRDLIDWTTSTFDILKLLTLLPFQYFGLNKDWTRLLPQGLIRGTNFERYLNQLFTLPAAHAKIPLFITTVDIVTAESIIFTDPLFSRGYELGNWLFLPMLDKGACVRASCSLPGLFTPRVIDGRSLVDGAVRMNIPAEVLVHAGCDKVIVVDLHETEMKNVTEPPKTFLDMFMRGVDIMQNEIIALQLMDENVFALQPMIKGVGFTSFDKIEYCIELGRQEALNKMAALKKYLK
ncbi:patatin-like phospholipase family protein [Tumebacillus algifaecis]|uniref:patatin-like phospholipase family protein n=1 Tax=Tumebacillus algifaecis TaxID=1214604 RepID=UPI0012FD7B78|nr:patatin-like phospholipase family protein [Tumebacillus algifaecis]